MRKFVLYSFMTAMVYILAAMPYTVSAKKRQAPKMYMFGFSASFNDSTVYFTNIQELDSVWYDTKTKFILSREEYAAQLKSYLTNSCGLKARTCIVLYGRKMKKTEKKLTKMKKQYTIKSKNKYDIRYISNSDFSFKPVEYSEDE
ncbi:MAG: hypothetical protein ACI4BA_06345 [Prevotella sp.]